MWNIGAGWEGRLTQRQSVGVDFSQPCVFARHDVGSYMGL